MYTINIVLDLLKNQGKTQKQLCDALGIGKQTFSNWKSGLSSSYTKYLPQIADFFQVSVDYLLREESVKEKDSAEDDESLREFVVYHRDGKTHKVKFTPEQLKIFQALVDSANSGNTDK